MTTTTCAGKDSLKLHQLDKVSKSEGFKSLSSHGYAQCFQVLYVMFKKPICRPSDFPKIKQPEADYVKRWVLNSCSSYMADLKIYSQYGSRYC